MGRLKGTTVTLIKMTKTSEDPFGAPIYQEERKEIRNVLIAPASQEEIKNRLDWYGEKVVYTLAIPKGDTNDFEDQALEFFGKRWKVVGIPEEGIEELIPMAWHKKVTVARYG